MKGKKYLLISILLTLITFSCQDDDIERNMEEEKEIMTKSLSEEELNDFYRYIDGGSLPEVVVTANYPPVALEFASSGGGGGTGPDF